MRSHFSFLNIYSEPEYRTLYKDHPFEVLLHATRHGYPELMDIAQVRALELPLVDAFGLFPPTAYIAYVNSLTLETYEQLLILFLDALSCAVDGDSNIGLSKHSGYAGLFQPHQRNPSLL